MRRSHENPMRRPGTRGFGIRMQLISTIPADICGRCGIVWTDIAAVGYAVTIEIGLVRIESQPGLFDIRPSVTVGILCNFWY